MTERPLCRYDRLIPWLQENLLTLFHVLNHLATFPPLSQSAPDRVAGACAAPGAWQGEEPGSKVWCWVSELLSCP